MAKRRHSGSEEMLMVPFLDILCSLIGVLVLIIVFLCVSQANQTEGRTQEEVNRAIEYKKLNKLQLEKKTDQELAKTKQDALAELQKKLDEQEQKLARYRKLISTSTEVKNLNAKMSQDALKELDNLLLEIDGYKLQAAELKKEISLLLAEIAKRKPPTNAPPPPVIVQPSGSGTGEGTKAFFVEASGGLIRIYWDAEKRTQISSAAQVIIADTSYDYFLKSVKAVPGAKIIFLVRDDGFASYTNAAGWAQQTYEILPSQVAKLPIPGRGEVDLKMFKDLMGSIPPPPDAKLIQEPAKPKI